MRDHISHLLGTIGMLLIAGLWLGLLNAHRADVFVDRLAGPQHEYKIVLGAGLLATLLAFVAAARGSKWWYAGVALASGTVAFFVVKLAP
jgi:hypothetical protein